jgi:hypothetical protein
VSRSKLAQSRVGSRSALRPKAACNFQRVDLQALPPCNLIAGLMQLTMVDSAKRHRELITDLENDTSRLRKTQVMRIGRSPPADDAGL